MRNHSTPYTSHQKLIAASIARSKAQHMRTLHTRALYIGRNQSAPAVRPKFWFALCMVLGMVAPYLLTFML